ncbi:glucosamine-6-phosphate deaminase [Weissella koreensis]|uniref:Glucosamine-6-phosphate deaminase n=1 Tax=Weissella koreensis TaxID=165096 RepID=A0A7H1MKK5_9LACO|nr:glucosamine-6-phosphate deaminase [Weissella koreensis]AVH74788.1 glucosamine-6-phosphate deaminase [Weissella koreensis]EJF33697.1 glucosamine-6-phosphate deaminase [Weissella koreensis KCTC 3621]EJF34099.1 glucosamine-6-phosphate deaminase [Weissella koreensis KCTC 3621]MCZ9310586.1 glucosamine-6-phosphate deaminase [Weissella koreensis]QGN20013.1 glucosamine-6-phosphate deaminase [Weissella koreensis]
MKIIKVQDQVEGGQVGARVFQDALQTNAKVFGLATGSTPISIYDAITKSDMDFSDKISINLDEYKGLSGDHEQSYRYFMQQHLFNEKPFKESYVPDGLNPDGIAESERYDAILDQFPRDLQILGLGQNGHIGFNEPGTSFESTTHEVDLTASTIEANARFFDDQNDVPRQAYSMGIKSIMSAKQILMVAYGANKAQAVQAMIEGPVTENVPASILQKHDNVVVILDEAAASNLNK